MNVDWNNLPESIQPFKSQILVSKRNCIELHLIPCKKLTLWQSNVGGKPYLPIDSKYPCNIEGEHLKLIVQINFAELPTNELYPTHGILQFYINVQDRLWGLDKNQQKQNNFRVVYFEDVSQEETQLQHDFPIQDLDEEMGPIYGQYAIQFTLGESYIAMNDVNFFKQVVDIDATYDSKVE